ncbi:MAG: TVP38/TMEM64 family protein [Phycisphaerales bacterium]|nr:TVP38/TMEM64 family protein [Phycisphaerales bacterium]
MTSRQTMHLKLAAIVAGIVVLILVPYFLWHEPIDAYFESPEFADRVVSVKPYAWAVAIALLIGDLFLPIPAAPVVATAGGIYGTFWGGVIGAVGSFLAGLVAYALARLAGRRAARFLASEQEMADFQLFFDTWGVAGIIASRAMPVVPEVLTFMAGLARMHPKRFASALALGSIPMGFLLAWTGSATGTSSTLLLVLTLLPAGLWCVYLVWAQSLRARRLQPAAKECKECQQ